MPTTVAAMAGSGPGYKIQRQIRAGKIPARKIANTWLIGPDAGDFCSLADAAHELGISLTRAYQLVWRGSLPATKITRNWMVRRTDIAAFASQVRPQGTPGHRPPPVSSPCP